MATYNLGRISTLIVDDSDNMLTLFRTALSAFGMTAVYTSTEVKHAFELFNAKVPDLVFCDLVMDPLDGLALVHRIRNDPNSKNPYVPMIVVSGHSEPDRVHAARDVGANDFLVKPVSARSLYVRIMDAIENPRAFVRNETFFGPCRRRRNDGPPEGTPERRAVAT